MRGDPHAGGVALDVAAEVLRGNDAGGYTRPSPGLYPHQWNWDSAFCALGWSALDVERAWRELELLVAAQDAEGMIAHIAFDPAARTYWPGPEWWGGRTGRDGRPVSAITQPPVAATCLALLQERHPQPPERVRPIVLALHRWHRWFMTRRLVAGEPVIVHPWESGRDNAPEWDVPLSRVTPCDEALLQRRDTGFVDAAQRPATRDYRRYLALVALMADAGWDQRTLAERGAFRVLDPGFTAVLAAACDDLAGVAARLGDAEVADEEAAWSDALASALRARLGEDGRAGVVDLVTGERFPGCGAADALTELLPGLPSRAASAVADLVVGGALDSAVGVRSTSVGSPGFDAVNYWRGPVWANVTWLTALGLERRGLTAAAAVLRDRLRTFAQTAGMAEYAHPDDGRPLGGRDFSWTAALLLWERDG